MIYDIRVPSGKIETNGTAVALRRLSAASPFTPLRTYKELMETQSEFIGIQSMQADTTVY